ncbi:MAG: helix-turn-helix transcriptional regulator [Candidatus Obscuribacterales bacterium]|nr:helix-turn-helix transcriptional regulator [Candidatus Obscuribacterales bacterium]
MLQSSNMQTASKLGAAIACRRILAEMTIAELSKKVGVPTPIMTLIERGQDRPGLLLLQEIASCLDTSSIELIKLGIELGTKTNQ